MNQKKRILVIGATGAQGGSVARALLAQEQYIVRILTRNPTSDKAIELLVAGAEIAVGDLENLETLKRAMKDCYGVFGVTNYSEHYSREFHQGVNLINAVYNCGIRHFVFHTRSDYNKLSGGKTGGMDVQGLLNRFGAGKLDKDGDGDVDMQDLTSMFSGGGVMDKVKGMFG